MWHINQAMLIISEGFRLVKKLFPNDEIVNAVGDHVEVKAVDLESVVLESPANSSSADDVKIFTTLG